MTPPGTDKSNDAKCRSLWIGRILSSERENIARRASDSKLGQFVTSVSVHSRFQRAVSEISNVLRRVPRVASVEFHDWVVMRNGPDKRMCSRLCRREIRIERVESFRRPQKESCRVVRFGVTYAICSSVLDRRPMRQI